MQSNYVGLIWTHSAEMNSSVGWDSLLTGLFRPKCAQIAPGGAESDFGLKGWVSTLGLKQIFFFQFMIILKIVTI